MSVILRYLDSTCYVLYDRNRWCEMSGIIAKTLGPRMIGTCTYFYYVLLIYCSYVPKWDASDSAHQPAIIHMIGSLLPL